ncbi:unnamed protein product [Blepharisma stoltei]|uniref:Uncharacterized protein n=1 Tax=Blepharisma stoltei TaxID=1481888 RepID=A0AAU9IYQ9_9CILI|nr:unnamed protein product [Blepharisma stoltei]
MKSSLYHDSDSDSSITQQQEDLTQANILWQWLSPQQKKFLTSQKSVSLYHSRWHKKGGIPSLFPGKILIQPDNPEFIQWTWPHDLHKNLISIYDIKQASGFLQGTKALDVLLSIMRPKDSISPSTIIAIAVDGNVLIVVFDNEETCKNWKAGLLKMLNSLNILESDGEEDARFLTVKGSGVWTRQTSVDALDSRAYIFDLSEPNIPNSSWREIKATLVYEDDSSHSEYLIFDRSQENLNNSVNEVLRSIETHLDFSNRELLKEYLEDIMRNELKLRNDKKESFKMIKNKVVPYTSYKKRSVKRFKREYSGINGGDISKEIINQLNGSEKLYFGNKVTNAFQMLFLQRLSLSLETHFLAKESKRRKINEEALLLNTEKNNIEVDVKMNQKEIERKIDEIMQKRVQNNQNSNNDDKDKSYGCRPFALKDACSCLLM